MHGNLCQFLLDFSKAMFNGCLWQGQSAHFTGARLTLCRTCPSVWEPTRACSSKPACRTIKEKELSGNYSVTSFKQLPDNSEDTEMFLKVHWIRSMFHGLHQRVSPTGLLFMLIQVLIFRITFTLKGKHLRGFRLINVWLWLWVVCAFDQIRTMFWLGS